MAQPLIIERNLIAGSIATVINVTLTNANTEYSFSIPSYTRMLSLKARNTNHTAKLTFEEGQSGTTYFTLDSGSAWNENMILPTNLTVYCQSPDAGCVLELVVWS